MATFGELLQELRKDHRLSQKQLADVIPVTTGTVSNYENNQHLPDIEKAHYVGRLFWCDNRLSFGAFHFSTSSRYF